MEKFKNILAWVMVSIFILAVIGVIIVGFYQKNGFIFLLLLPFVLFAIIYGVSYTFAWAFLRVIKHFEAKNEKSKV